MRFRRGELVHLAYPNNPELVHNEEVEIISLADKRTETYNVQVWRTGHVLLADERMLSRMDDRRAIVRWEDCAWMPEEMKGK